MVALDSIIFGFDNESLKVLLVKRGIEPNTDVWSLMGGWLQPNESLDEAANRILSELTGMNNVYLEQVYAYGKPKRDPVERTVSVTYFALINVDDYEKGISDNYNTRWFGLNELPELLFDHKNMVEDALKQLRHKASQHLIGFELLPEKFTLPQLQKLYEAIYDTTFDKRNFSRKIIGSDFLTKTDEKQLGFSKKGAYYYSLNKENYEKIKNSSYNF